MFNNPFTPIFGGKPDFFFGRKGILKRFEVALIDRGSEDRVLFLTGVRGSGKTALIEQLSRRADGRGWLTIDLGSDNLAETLLRQLVKQSDQTQTISPSASLSIFGTGGSLSTGSISKTIRYTTEDLQLVFLDFCKKHSHGVFVSIDEVQKVPIEELSSVCEAFQMASRKGYDVILVLAGLPYAYEKVIHHEGCTFMRRGVHERIGLFTREEANAAFRDGLFAVDGLSVEDAELNSLVEASCGHPYLIQLLGYHLVVHLNSIDTRMPHTVTNDDVTEAVPRAIEAYERRALRPMLDELSREERSYLVATSCCLNADREAAVAEIARELGKDTKQLSRVRESLIKRGILVSPARGLLRFNIPYLARYVQIEPTDNPDAELSRTWGL